MINKIIKATQDYSAGGVNTVGGGGRIEILQTIGIGEAATVEWAEVEHSNRVTARSDLGVNCNGCSLAMGTGNEVRSTYATSKTGSSMP